MSGREELQARIKEKNERIHELINKFILTPEISELSKDVARLRVLCGEVYGHEYQDGVCKWCGSKEGYTEE